MLKLFYRLRRKKGFTLIELIVVISIIAVLASIMIPSFIGYYVDSKINTANATAATIQKRIEIFLAELDIQHVGMKRTPGVNAQGMFMVKNGTGMVKTECKIGKNRSDTDGSKTFFDHKNWWKNNATALMLDTTTRSDPNHQLALCRAVADSCEGLKTGFIMAFFSAGVCRGVVYMPDCDYLWPGNYPGIPGDLTSGRQQKRPLLVHGRTDPAPRLDEFSPWDGIWPESADEHFWDGRAGLDKEGFIVGTYPVIGFA